MKYYYFYLFRQVTPFFLYLKINGELKFKESGKTLKE